MGGVYKGSSSITFAYEIQRLVEEGKLLTQVNNLKAVAERLKKKECFSMLRMAVFYTILVVTSGFVALIGVGAILIEVTGDSENLLQETEAEISYLEMISGEKLERKVKIFFQYLYNTDAEGALGRNMVWRHENELWRHENELWRHENGLWRHENELWRQWTSRSEEFDKKYRKWSSANAQKPYYILDKRVRDYRFRVALHQILNKPWIIPIAFLAYVCGLVICRTESVFVGLTGSTLIIYFLVSAFFILGSNESIFSVVIALMLSIIGVLFILIPIIFVCGYTPQMILLGAFSAFPSAGSVPLRNAMKKLSTLLGQLYLSTAWLFRFVDFSSPPDNINHLDKNKIFLFSLAIFICGYFLFLNFLFGFTENLSLYSLIIADYIGDVIGDIIANIFIYIILIMMSIIALIYMISCILSSSWFGLFYYFSFAATFTLFIFNQFLEVEFINVIPQTMIDWLVVIYFDVGTILFVVGKVRKSILLQNIGHFVITPILIYYLSKVFVLSFTLDGSYIAHTIIVCMCLVICYFIILFIKKNPGFRYLNLPAQSKFEDINSPEKLVLYLQKQSPNEQFIILKKTTENSLGITIQEFVSLLREQQDYITKEPAVSLYWKQLNKYEQIIRQDG